MDQVNTRELIDNYLKAFEAQDLQRCMDYFDPEAKLEWMMGNYDGRPSIEEWHKDRFAAGLKVLHVDEVTVQGTVITLDLTITSKRLQAWRMPALGGRVMVEFQSGKIQRTKFSVKSINPQQNWA